MDLKDKMRNVKGAANKRKQLVDQKKGENLHGFVNRGCHVFSQVFTIMCEAVVRLRKAMFQTLVVGSTNHLYTRFKVFLYV